MLISIEGIDGTGKSSLIEGLKQELKDLDPVFTKEPGASGISFSVKEAILSGADPVAIALLFAADHAEHLRIIIKPALETNKIVISDRYIDSRFAYQILTLQGKVSDPLIWLRNLHEGWSIPPDRTFLIIVPVEIALERCSKSRIKEPFETDKILREVQKNYMNLAIEDPKRFVLIDGLLTKKEILNYVLESVRNICALLQ